MPDQPQHLVLKGLRGVLAEKHLHLVGGVSNAAGHAVVLMVFDGKLPSALSLRQNEYFLRPFVLFQQILREFRTIISLAVPPIFGNRGKSKCPFTERRKTGVFEELF